MKCFLVSAIALLVTSAVFADVCKDLANHVDKEYDFEEVNSCHECGWHKVTVDRRQPPESLAALLTDLDLFRVGSTGPAWCGSDDGGDYLEIAFDRKMKIGGLAIQGGNDLEEGIATWITSFQVSYDDGTGDFDFIKDENGPMQFQGNTNALTATEKKFPIPVTAVAVRIHPITDHNEPCMKVDIYACSLADATLAPGALSDDVSNADCQVNVLEDCGDLKCLGMKFKRDMFNCEMCECEDEPDLGKFESDIDLSQMPLEILRGAYGGRDNTPDNVFKAAGREGKVARWKDYKRNGQYLIPYVVSGGINFGSIKAAIDHLAERTCIQLVRRSNQPYYINFYRGGGCSSPVGKLRGGNRVSIGYGCENTGIVVHEILHSLGFWHEQSRPDRDSYVRIQTQNIRSGLTYNFQKRSTSDIDSMGSPYDLSSLMHYGAYAFSSNGRPTIVSLRGGTLGQRRGLSAEDIKQINSMYGCDTTGGTTKPTTRPTTSRGTTTRATTRATTTRRPTGNCRDQNQHCGYWARIGECNKNPAYMKVYCKKSCRVCGDCRDLNGNCQSWSRYCRSSQYYGFMSRNCPKTCGRC